MRILVCAPHPDDEIIGCGGSLINWIRRGAVVAVVYLTSGEAGSLVLEGEELARKREEEVKRSARLLDIGDIHFLKNPDGYLEYSKTNLVRLVRIVRETKPDLIYIPHAGENHPDHEITHRLMLEAIRRAAGPWFPECGRETWTVSSVLGYEVLTPLTNVSYVEDITEVMELKLEALREHASQLQEISYDDAVMSLNRFRGITTGRGRYCEGFQVITVSRL